MIDACERCESEKNTEHQREREKKHNKKKNELPIANQHLKCCSFKRQTKAIDNNNNWLTNFVNIFKASNHYAFTANSSVFCPIHKHNVLTHFFNVYVIYKRHIHV